MNLIHTLPDWLIITGILLAPLAWTLIGKTISAANPEKWRVVNKVALVMFDLLEGKVNILVRQSRQSVRIRATVPAQFIAVKCYAAKGS